jgi:hypothetical protein
VNAPAKLPPVTKIDKRHARRIEQLSLAACALWGLVRPGFTGPIPHDHQDVVMKHLDDLFGFTSPESDRARDMLFEGTLNHAIHENDRPRILACANELTRIAANYRGTEEQGREIYAAGFDLFEIDALWEASQPAERGPGYPRVTPGDVDDLCAWGRA